MMEELREKIAKDVNESNLPLDCVYYLFKDLFKDLEMQYGTYIQQMKEQKQHKEENKIIDNLTDDTKNEEKGE